MTASGELDQRFYTSQFGRFMSADRFKQAGKTSSSGSWNKYGYGLGDPVNRADRRGTDSCGWDDDPEYCDPDPFCSEERFITDGSNCDPGGGGGPGPGGGGPGPGVGDDPPKPTCEQQLTATIGKALTGTPLANEASDFVTDAQNAGLNPLLLVAIAGAESSYGATAPKGSDNAFGLLHGVKGQDGKIHYVPFNYSSWNAGIIAAASTVDHQFERGNVTVALLYSGNTGAYCVGNCAAGQTNVAKIFTSLGGGDPNNAFNLLWPCND